MYYQIDQAMYSHKEIPYRIQFKKHNKKKISLKSNKLFNKLKEYQNKLSIINLSPSSHNKPQFTREAHHNSSHKNNHKK